MAETLLKLIEKYDGRVKMIENFIEENDPSVRILVDLGNRRQTYEEIISDLQFLLNNPY